MTFVLSEFEKKRKKYFQYSSAGIDFNPLTVVFALHQRGGYNPASL